MLYCDISVVWCGVTYSKVTGWHVVDVRLLCHPVQVLAEEAQGVVMIPGELTH